MNASISGRTLTASQLDFLDLVVAELTQHGAMDPGRLDESPFTGLAPQGPESLVKILDDVRAAALASSEGVA